MNTSPRTTKEALFAEMLGDLDNMLNRIENLPKLVENCEHRLKDSAVTLESAGKQYGQAVTAFTEQAKVELIDFIERKSATAIEKHAAILKKDSHASLFAGQEKIRPFAWSGLLKQAAIALLASFFTVLMLNSVYYFS